MGREISVSEEIEHNPSRFLGLVETDDVVDVFLAMYTNGRVTGNKVGPHRDLLDEFRYLGPPHAA
jgi:hypothetical protein